MILDLFDNPIAQESEYRAYVVHHIPSVELLDRKGEFHLFLFLKSIICLDGKTVIVLQDFNVGFSLLFQTIHIYRVVVYP